MKITLAQVKFKTGDFKFNYKSIANELEKSSSDLIVFPQAGLEDLGGKDLLIDENANLKQSQMYNELAENFSDKTFLLGDILFKNGEIALSSDGFYEVRGKKILRLIIIMMKLSVICMFLQKIVIIQ